LFFLDGFNFLRPRQERQAIYSGKRTSRTSVQSLQDLCVEILKEHVDGKYFSYFKKKSNVFFFCIDVCHTHFHRLPYDIVKPILDSATPEQLNFIIDNNPVGRLRYFISK